ncbi:MAG: tetratricopeptide repeat protein [Elainellaceae cyanobacterium]
MSEPSSLHDRYSLLIEQIVQTVLKGQLRSKEQIYQQLVQDVSKGTGEIFERALQARIETVQTQLKSETDELKQAKATRIQRALNVIQGEWERYQQDQKVMSAVATATQAVIEASPQERIITWLRWVDPNQDNHLSIDQLESFTRSLDQAVATQTIAEEQELQQLVAGIRTGIASWRRLEDYVIRWIYEMPTAIGFEGTPKQWGPWKIWAEQVGSSFPKHLFSSLEANQALADAVRRYPAIAPKDAVELVVLLQYLQRGLVAWFEKQPYDSKWGTKQSIATFLTFAAIWSQLSIGFGEASNLGAANRQQLSQVGFQVLLQILRSFSQQPYFPLYGGVFALFSNDYLKDALSYLDEPLRQVHGTQEKARILTLIGYSYRALGQYEQAITLYQQALETAQSAADQVCEIADLNHLSRTYAAQKNFTEASRHSQRALVMARQRGDRLGEANALTNVGYSEVLSARQLERMESEAYEMAIRYLEQGLELSEKLGDRQSQSLCYNSLGIAYVILEQPREAVPYLEKGVQTAQLSGDLYLQGLNLAYLAEALYGLGDQQRAIGAALMGMYLLEQINAAEWRQPAGLLTILQGQIGVEALQAVRSQYRSEIIAAIGVDGYDHLPQLLEKYRRSMD